MSLFSERREPNSSVIKRWEYPRFGGDTLKVTFTSGATYAYDDVPRDLVAEMKAIERDGGSVGRWFADNIRPYFDGERV